MDKTSGKYHSVLIYVILALGTAGVFWQVRNCDFVGFDDDDYVAKNDHVKSGLTVEGTVWAFTTNHSANWHPLTWLSHMLDCQLFDLHAGRHHLTNLFLHIANTLLLFAVLKRMTGAVWRSAFVAAAFAVHPLHVESVAWIAERKDILSTLFWMLTIGAYARYTERQGRGWYVLTLAAFALGLMAKPMLVTLPFVLLLLDYWPLGRFEFGEKLKTTKWPDLYRLIVEKIPLFALSAVSCAVTVLVQHSYGAVASLSKLPIEARVLNAFIAYLKYIEKTFWPSRLAVYYPFPRFLSLVLGVAAAVLLLVTMRWIIVLSRKHKYLPVGWLWYIGTLVPVIGVVQVGGQAWANRYSYIPLIGLFIIIAWAVPELLAKLPYRKIILGISAVTAISALSVCTYHQLGYWQNKITLFNRVVEVTEDNYYAHLMLAGAFRSQGQLNEAIEHYEQALRIKPSLIDTQNAIGLALVAQHRYSEAIGHYNEALRINPDYFEAHINIAVALSYQGNFDKAWQHYNQALQIRPGYVAPAQLMEVLSGKRRPR